VYRGRSKTTYNAELAEIAERIVCVFRGFRVDRRDLTYNAELGETADQDFLCVSCGFRVDRRDLVVI
jgi:hypothetical protein